MIRKARVCFGLLIGLFGIVAQASPHGSDAQVWSARLTRFEQDPRLAFAAKYVKSFA